MFTGIISQTANVQKIERPVKQNSNFLLTIANPYSKVKLGESIAVNGICLTVVDYTKKQLQFYVSPETIKRTNLKQLQPKQLLNLERAMQAHDRFSGHFVQGHVDGLAQLKSIKKIESAYQLVVRPPAHLMKYCIPKGSLALDGISLTINSIKKSDLYLMIIPHTWQNTHLQTKKVGDYFNLEADMIAKVIEKFYVQYHRRRH